jgi:rod shape-determining protein MreC
MLILDPDSAVSVRLSASGERGVLIGQRDDLLRFALIDQDTEVQPGETVETSGYEIEEGLRGLFPSGIPIGVVDRVEPDDAGLTVNVLVRPNVDFSRLNYVLLVTGSEDLPVESSPGATPSPEER